MRHGISALACALAALTLSGCVTINTGPANQPLGETRLSGTGRDKLLLIDVEGFLSGQERGNQLLGEPMPSLVSEVTEVLRKAERDRRIKGVVVRINSPGGTVTASDTIYHELLRYKQRTKLPMVAHMLDLGTSGAYYIAQAADRIVVQPTTVTGSIGVIMVRPSVSGLLGKIGVETEEITSGPHKGMGSPFHPLGDEDRALFQSVIDDLYGRFVDAVVAGRPTLSRERIAALADGRIYTAEQARVAGLVDGIGYLDDAVDGLKAAAGLTSATVVTYTRPGQYKGSIYAAPVVNVDLDLFPANQPGFLYLWRP
ncbi:MAG: signal peptide peptidase SppA [Nitrospirota bacterium]